MINDNILADRLNAFRSGEPLPEPETQEYLDQLDEVQEKISNFTKISYELINLFLVIFRSLIFGFAIKTIFITNWEFLAIFAVGFSIETITSRLFNIFTK